MCELPFWTSCHFKLTPNERMEGWMGGWIFNFPTLISSTHFSNTNHAWRYFRRLLDRLFADTNILAHKQHTCPHAFIHERKLLEDAQGALLFKVLPGYLRPSSGVRMTHKITKPNGCLTQTTPLGCLCCTAVSFKSPWSNCWAFQKKHDLLLKSPALKCLIWSRDIKVV